MRKPLLLKLLAATAVVAAGWQIHEHRHSPAASFHLDARVPSSGEAFSSALAQTTGARLEPGHRVALLEDAAVFDALDAAIRAAQSSVHLEIYIWNDGAASRRVLAALAARRKGAACRVLLDAFGSQGRGEAVDRGLAAAGCEVRLFRAQLKLTRNHRKLLIVDGSAAITGGFGIDDRWTGDSKGRAWRDTAVRIDGPVVAAMQDTFAQDWQEAGGALLPADAYPKIEPAGTARAAFVRSTESPVVTQAERLTWLAIAAAHQRLFVENAYVMPGRHLLEALAQRAREGVDVRLLAPGRQSDSKTSFLVQQKEYGGLTQAGVKVLEYQPAMLHAKTMVVDGALSIIGSVNLDPLSLDENEEGALVVEDAALAEQLARAFERDARQAVAQK